MAKETPKEVQLQQEEELEELAELPEEEQVEAVPEIKEEAPATEEAKEEEAEAKQKRKKKEEEFAEERFYTIPLQKALIRPPKKRAPRAMQLIKLFIVKHMKMGMKVSEDEEAEELPQLVVTQEVNEKVWTRGIEKPPRKIKVRVTKDKDGNVTVHLAENQ
ncbi:MAG TPA: 50S ribosomal protein L31e [Candidatus Deferrimicrobiaceae bacterium]|jgi:large subunit ribosomal protein L31e|nr:50S ribosomal protein L31e [Candidatus Deferrimicrobiaceae bacterium]